MSEKKLNVGDMVYVISNDTYNYSVQVVNSVDDDFDYHGNHYYKITISDSVLKKTTITVRTISTTSIHENTYVFDMYEVHSVIKDLIKKNIEKCQDELKKCQENECNIIERIKYLKSKKI